jgi:hypothetical protein
MLRTQKPFLFLLGICISLLLQHINGILIFRMFRLELEILIGTIGLSYPSIGRYTGRSIHSFIGQRLGELFAGIV